MKIHFYPHRYLRDRHLDTIRRWPAHQVLNPELADRERGAQVSEQAALSGSVGRNWRQRLPLANIKIRPKEAPLDAVIYVWGAVIATGKFIVDLDNPYSLVAYNPSAMTLWRHALSYVLRSTRCVQIRCISEACRAAVGELFGKAVLDKAIVVYPRMTQQVTKVDRVELEGPRFLFVGTQFLIKGGPELLEAFRQVRFKIPSAQLDVVTHLPTEYVSLAQPEGVQIHKANFSRSEIWSKFMRNADVLVHPSYMESFGMVILEAISNGLAVVANDVYAHREMVLNGENGILLEPPVHYWSGVLAGPLFLNQFDAGNYIKRIDKAAYVKKLADAMVAVAEDPARLLSYRQKSCTNFTQMMGHRSCSEHER
jgi:glycosyltransferase involved in cell wall biosynthesis